MDAYKTDELPLPQQTDEEANFLPPLEPPPAGTIRYIDIHVYDQQVGEEEELTEVESILHESEPPPVVQHELNPQQPMTTGGLRRYKGLVPLLFAVVSLLLITTITVVVMLPLFIPTAIITIIPVSKQISTTSTITITTEPTSAPGQLEGRVLPAITMSQAKTIQTTGMAHRDAQVARGLVIFYNAAPYAQTVAAGTLLTGADGMQIVTDQDAVIPAGNLATNGQTSVSANATTPGPSGNIQAGDVYGQCCRMDVLANNTVFSGGESAREYHTVTKQDITNAITSLSTSLQQSVQAALQAQVQSAETLISPLPCTQTVMLEHAAGAEAIQDRIMVNETCTGMTYLTQNYQRMIIAILAHQAHLTLGAGYTLTGPSQTIITRVSIKHETLTLHVRLMGTYVYQFSQEQQAQIKARIVGMSKAQAIPALLSVSGVQSVSITTKNGEMLSTDTTHIQIIFVLMP